MWWWERFCKINVVVKEFNQFYYRSEICYYRSEIINLINLFACFVLLTLILKLIFHSEKHVPLFPGQKSVCQLFIYSNLNLFSLTKEFKKYFSIYWIISSSQSFENSLIVCSGLFPVAIPNTENKKKNGK